MTQVANSYTKKLMTQVANSNTKKLMTQIANSEIKKMVIFFMRDVMFFMTDVMFFVTAQQKTCMAAVMKLCEICIEYMTPVMKHFMMAVIKFMPSKKSTFLMRY